MSDIRDVAIHESAHVAAAVLEGFVPAYVSIRGEYGRLGFLMIEPSNKYVGLKAGIVIMAGPAAMSMSLTRLFPMPRAFPGAWYYEPTSAALGLPEELEQLTSESSVSDVDRMGGVDCDMDAARAAARTLIDSHWDAVVALAEELIRCGDMRGPEISGVLRAHGIVSGRPHVLPPAVLRGVREPVARRLDAFQRRMNDLRAQLARGIIDEQQFNAEGKKAGRTMVAGIRAAQTGLSVFQVRQMRRHKIHYAHDGSGGTGTPPSMG